MKRVMSIQDLSCLGKCSLSVALPIISSAGIETCVIPTAILSTHTRFDNVHFKDLSYEMLPIGSHWEKEGFEFDCISSGYLGNKKQVDNVIKLIGTFKKEKTIVIVDPAMADNGKLYSGIDKDFPLEIKRLCTKADIILPNKTEGCLLTDTPYKEDMSVEKIQDILIKLSAYGPKYAVITGVELSDKSYGFMGYDSLNKEFFSYGTKKINYKTSGTGDIFTSAFIGAYMNEYSVYESLRIAADYTSACIENTFNDPDRIDYGTNFEKEIPYYIELLNKH
ncbi:MAG: pyridoxamine kinase [Erysipelotrichaceae bacterium]|nr:pyridoxamine kinase [Erysipelotrichaceae bacterium]